jgi:hypothetical protein
MPRGIRLGVGTMEPNITANAVARTVQSACLGQRRVGIVEESGRGGVDSCRWEDWKARRYAVVKEGINLYAAPIKVDGENGRKHCHRLTGIRPRDHVRFDGKWPSGLGVQLEKTPRAQRTTCLVSAANFIVGGSRKRACEMKANLVGDESSNGRR